MGYAFVNFVDPLAIINFGQARVGTTWNVFASEKICDLSYANIQGKAALVEKFRNSCVMDEQDSYRPHIYYSSGPLKGEAQEFPNANDLSRKARSANIAQEIGLFPPIFPSWSRPHTQANDNRSPILRSVSAGRSLVPCRVAPKYSASSLIRSSSFAGRLTHQ